jgi:hypothetical protein
VKRLRRVRIAIFSLSTGVKRADRAANATRSALFKFFPPSSQWEEGEQI